MNSILTIPNLLTFMRMALIPVFASLLYYGYSTFALAVFVVAGVSDGIDGFLVDPRDSEAVAARVSALFAEPALYQRIGAAGRLTSLNRFSPEAYVERVARVYDSALEGAR